MNPELQKQVELFRKLAVPNLGFIPKPERTSKKESSKTKTKVTNKSSKKSKSSKKLPRLQKEHDTVASKSRNIPKQSFLVLSNIVMHLKKRRGSGKLDPLSFDEILIQTDQSDLSSDLKHWLVTEALVNNLKIQVFDDGKYEYKPPFDIKSRKELMELLRKHDKQGLGGIILNDALESLPDAERDLKVLGDRIITITGQGRKKVIFYNDDANGFDANDEFVSMWRGISVADLDEKKVESLLIGCNMQPIMAGAKKVIMKRKKSPVKRNNGKRKKIFNEHLELEEYSKDKF